MQQLVQPSEAESGLELCASRTEYPHTAPPGIRRDHVDQRRLADPSLTREQNRRAVRGSTFHHRGEKRNVPRAPNKDGVRACTIEQTLRRH